MTAPTAPASLREDVALREALTRACLNPGPAAGRRGDRSLSEWQADAILAGPLAARDAGRDTLIATLRADLAAAETQNEALHEKLKALAPHGSCACSYDKPGDVCLYHSPALAAAHDRIAEMKRALKPFSEISPFVQTTHRRDGERVHEQQRPDGTWMVLTRAHFRAARSAHHPEEMHDER